MKAVRYSQEAARDLRRRGNIAGRVRRAISDGAADPGANANNVTQLIGSPLYRMRIGDYRANFEETADTVMVTTVRPRDSPYD
jgi:mRNA interferase RelE/StbE